MTATRPPSPRRSPRGPLLLDGAMGSLLYERGVLHTRSYDELNLSQPRADPHRPPRLRRTPAPS